MLQGSWYIVDLHLYIFVVLCYPCIHLCPLQDEKARIKTIEKRTETSLLRTIGISGKARKRYVAVNPWSLTSASGQARVGNIEIE